MLTINERRARLEKINDLARLLDIEYLVLASIANHPTVPYRYELLHNVLNESHAKRLESRIRDAYQDDNLFIQNKAETAIAVYQAQLLDLVKEL